MNEATKHFESLGYEVEYVGNKRSYDLKCLKSGTILRVEVKGTQSEGASIILTPNEISNAKKHLTALFVLHSIACIVSNGHPIPTGGESFILDPWELESHGKLKPLSYIYEIRSSE